MSAECCAADAAPPERAGRLRDVREIRLAALAGLGLALGLAAGAVGNAEVALAGYLVALVAGGLTFVPGALRRLARRRLGVDTLMAIAAIGAVALGEVAEAAALAFLFSVSEALEGYALARTRRGLRALLELVPPRARIRRGGAELTVGLEDLRPGDRLIVRPGERIATDGVVREGRSALDLSPITGESVPVERGPGDEVFAASINGRGALEVEVTRAAADNSLARIVRIVEEAQERKGRAERLAARIARPLVPGILVVALAVAVLGSLLGDPATWIERSLVVPVAAAPCAFAISVPVTVVAAIGAATRGGLLIKGGAALEALGRVRVMAFDKTGTLTVNRPSVVAVAGANGTGAEELLRLARALEARSEHPLAGAIMAGGAEVPAAERVEAVPGSGLVGRVDGTPVRLGRPGFVSPGVLAAEVERHQAEGATVVLVERSGITEGLIAVRDELRPEAAEAVAELHRMGIATVVLSGDNARTAAALGRRAGIGEVQAELLPADKAAAIARLRGRGPTAMVGDGINDAPALASADVGIAMGAMGTDVAIEAADVALMGDDLRQLPEGLRHARRAVGIMRQNLVLSGAIIVALIPLAATGALGLAAVVAVHEIAEVIVIANGVRAGRRAAAARPGPPVPRTDQDPTPSALEEAADRCCEDACCTGPVPAELPERPAARLHQVGRTAPR